MIMIKFIQIWKDHFLGKHKGKEEEMSDVCLFCKQGLEENE